METLFRFNLVREANRSRDEIDPIDLATNSQFQRDAAAIPNGANRRDALKSLARSYISSNRFIDNISASQPLRALEDAAAAIDTLLENGTTGRSDVGTALSTAFGGDPGDFIATPAVRGRMNALRDSILAIKLSPADHHRPIRRLVAILRAYHLAERYAQDTTFPADAATLAANQARSLRLPGAVLPTRPPQPPRPQPGSINDRLKELAERHDRLNSAIDEIKRLRPGDYALTPQQPSPELLPPEQLRPTTIFTQELAIRQASLRTLLQSAGGDITRPPTSGNQQTVNLGRLGDVSQALPLFRSENLGAETPGFTLGRGARIAMLGRADFQPVLPGLVGLRLSRQSQQALSRNVQSVFKEVGLKPDEPIARSLQQLQTERRRIYEQAQSLMQPFAQKTFKKIGKTSVAITANPMPLIFAMSPNAILGYLPGLLFDPAAGVPTTHADILPAGVMLLLLVKQQLKGYEGAEVSHIANMLRGEKKDRIHRTRLETETITFTETETTSATEQVLETTDRFEMRRESETALQEETAVKGSLMVKGKYGPTVEFKAEAEASWQRKSQESEKAANEVAREVTQKASEKITERVLRRESLRINRQVEETNQHSFDNSAGTEHISGVYQWVTKVYEAQMFSYGPRTVYDIMIPEPGAFLLEAFRRRRTAAVELDKPPAFEITPDQLNEDNYQTYITLYGATDVKPPPEPFITESYDFNTGGEDKDQEFTNSTRIKIPDGYQAVRGTVGAVVAVWDNWSVDVILGQRSHRFQSGSGWVWSTALDEETGAVPMAMVTDRVGDVAIAIEVICESTERALDLWRADTHAKLINAFRARQADYEAKLAELEAEAPDVIESGPSARNRALMTDEIKRACISVLTEQHFEMFDAIDKDSAGLPQINFTETGSEGPYVRFFEQAFEWENLSWVPYSYFWGRKSTWLDKIVIEDDDAEYEAFLKAGYVRVQIPVRPGFVDAVDHFRVFGDPWFGGSLPSISDETYLPIAEEIAERLGRPGNEVPVGEAWEVRVPTTLVHLRPDDTLPVWEKQPDGSWVEATATP